MDQPFATGACDMNPNTAILSHYVIELRTSKI